MSLADLHTVNALLPPETVATMVEVSRRLAESVIVRRGMFLPSREIVWECRECGASWDGVVDDPGANVAAHGPNCLAARVLAICSESAESAETEVRA